MPLGDRTGPEGKGPMTGRQAGYGAGYSVPGYKNRSVNANKKPVSKTKRLMQNLSVEQRALRNRRGMK